MNDPRHGGLYSCWISIDNGIIFILNNRFVLYIAGEYQCMNDFMYTTDYIYYSIYVVYMYICIHI